MIKEPAKDRLVRRRPTPPDFAIAFADGMPVPPNEHLIQECDLVYLVGEIDEFLVRLVASALFRLAVHNREEITLLISSEGGDVMGALAIADAVRYVRQRGVKVVGRVHGYAASAALLVLLACSERLATPDSVLMAHGMEGSFYIGDVRSIEAEHKLTQDLVRRMATQFARRTNKDVGFWHAILSDSTPVYFLTDEALEIGLIDGKVPEIDDA